MKPSRDLIWNPVLLKYNCLEFRSCWVEQTSEAWNQGILKNTHIVTFKMEMKIWKREYAENCNYFLKSLKNYILKGHGIL